MDQDQENVRFALGVVDDNRRLIASGKTQRWDVVKWAVTINTALTAASIALRQQNQSLGGRAFLLLVLFVAVLAAGLVLEVNRRMTKTRNVSRTPEQFLSKRGIAVSAIAGNDPERKVPFFYDCLELLIYGVILIFSILPALVLWLWWNDLSRLMLL